MAKVVIIAGPTASGKSAYAYKLAEDQKGVILNGDSVQVYQGLEILTAQPSPEEQRSIPHFLYGALDPSTSFSAGGWLSLVLPEIEKAHKTGKLPIVVGGTGLYLKALLEGLSPIPPLDPQIRRDLHKQKKSSEDLYKDLQRIDPLLAARLNPQDQQRILRGLEVFYGTGNPLSFWQSQKPSLPPYEFEKILFMPPQQDLEKRIEYRLEEMVKKGVIEEISQALSRPLSVNAKKAIGVKEFEAYLQGHCSVEDAKKLTLLHTRQYAKRQRTWFRHQFKEDFLVT